MKTIEALGWVRHEDLQPYLQLMRIDRPVGVLLLLWPTLAALWMAADGTPPLGLVAVFALGAFLMRAAGCVINDFADRNVDGAVQRTAARPLATGTVSPRAALVLFATLSVLAATLLLFLNELARWLAVAGIVIAATYPFTKRWTHMPQVVLGAAFSWGIVMAFAAVTGEVASSGWLMFVASVLWIVAYDTLYAMVDREDDIRVGIKSTAILFGNADRFMIGVLQASTLITLLLLADKLSYGILFDGSLVAITLLFAYQQRLIVKREPEGCFRAFANNVWVGFALFVGVVLQTTFGASIESLPPALP